ncbi:MAG: ribosome biogenesis GTP-binding protein YihA/YsxC [Bacilli bacterium]|nr:ribosome biogenesis GTP-binding protein YihA/YsxC [Bacilli bacterium]MDD4077153.1 ribosome biogenesis GTP-binding protein YihA/YsxC [Bacilli bacterium]
MFKKCSYVSGAVNKNQYPKNKLPEFLLLGRSNVGKSSLINALSDRKALAYISSQPGKTRILNFYLIDDLFYLVDAPGYGYALRSRSERLDFGRLIEEYLHENDNLHKVFLLVDTKVGPTADDKIMYEYLSHYRIDTIIIATKTDKIGKTRRNQYRNNIIEKLGIDDNQLIMTSAVEKTGIDLIKKLIAHELKMEP